MRPLRMRVLYALSSTIRAIRMDKNDIEATRRWEKDRIDISKLSLSLGSKTLKPIAHSCKPQRRALSLYSRAQAPGRSVSRVLWSSSTTLPSSGNLALGSRCEFSTLKARHMHGSVDYALLAVQIPFQSFAYLDPGQSGDGNLETAS